VGNRAVDRHRLQQLPDPIHLLELIAGGTVYHDPTVGVEVKEAFSSQLAHRLANRRRRGVHLFGDLRLEQADAWGELPREDRAPKPIRDHGLGRPVRIHVE
jgi:hypothetical protein